MLYEIRLTDGSRFEFEHDKPLGKGDLFGPPGMSYKTMRILLGEGKFDAIVEAEWRAGPAQAEYTAS